MREPHPLEGTGVSASPLGMVDCLVAADTIDEKLFVLDKLSGELEVVEERCLSPSGLVATGWELWSPDVDMVLCCWVEPESVASSQTDVGCCGGEVEEVDTEVLVEVSFLVSCCFWAFTSASDCMYTGNVNNCV